MLENMGTRIGQSQTVKGVTLTLEGAIWNDDKVLLSFAIDSAKIPKPLPASSRKSLQVRSSLRRRR